MGPLGITAAFSIGMVVLAHSQSDGLPVSFANERGITVHLFWDGVVGEASDGEPPISMGAIEPHGVRQINSFEGHRFSFRSASGWPVMHAVTIAADTTVVSLLSAEDGDESDGAEACAADDADVGEDPGGCAAADALAPWLSSVPVRGYHVLCAGVCVFTACPIVNASPTGPSVKNVPPRQRPGCVGSPRTSRRAARGFFSSCLTSVTVTPTQWQPVKHMCPALHPGTSAAIRARAVSRSTRRSLPRRRSTRQHLTKGVCHVRSSSLNH